MHYPPVVRFAEANSWAVMPENGNQSNVLALSKQNLIKKSMLLLVGLLIFTSVVLKAQSPQKINFQSIVRNTSGVIVSNKSVNFKITILSGTITGTPVYSETHLKTTDAIGLVSLQIGTGTVASGVFSSIDWGNALHFIKLEADFSGGNTYVTLGTQELMSVPYALYSAKTDTNSLNLTNRFAAKAPVNNPTFTGTVSGIDKAMVGLSDVNNTSDMDKPVSTATQTVLATKVNTSDTSSMLSKYLRKAEFPSGSNLGEFMYWNGSKWVSLSPGTTGQVLTMSSNGTPTWGCLITNSAGTPSSSPTLPVNTVLTTITIATTGATGIGTATGLPAGLTAVWSANVITISGTPTATGTFNYTIPLTGGCGTASAMGTITVNATVPGAPTGVVATAGNTSASVALVAPTNNGGSAITSYTVTSNPGGITATGTSPINVTGLTNGTSYTFTVVATNTVGSSASSAPSTAVTPATAPDAPTGVVATAGNTSASVAFVAPSSTGGSVITGYTVTSSPGGITAMGTTSPINVTGLTNGTAYTFTVVATNAVGNSVASAASAAVTPDAFTCGTSTVSDVDNNSYNTVLIGTQCWTKTNLKVTHYNDGSTVIPDETANTSGWGSLTTGARAVYTATGVTDYVGTYGYLYNWYAVNDSRKLCPTGWHVPTDAEWTTLTTYLGEEDIAGGKMKSAGNDYWNDPNTAATNESGFSALPGGYRDSFGSFFNIRGYAFFWSATEDVSDVAWSRLLFSSGGVVGRPISANDNAFYGKSVGASVRCLRD
jgi:uncharacterized protein (TIGR02145 family)